MRHLLIAAAVLLAATGVSRGLETVTFRRDGAEVQVSGRVLVEAKDGGVAIVDSQGGMWTIQKSEQVARSHDELPFRYLGARELGEALLKELPAGFSIHATAHYVICYNTSL